MVKQIFNAVWFNQPIKGKSLIAWFTHPDIAIACRPAFRTAKRGIRKILKFTILFAKQRGWSSEVKAD
ncbi:hypothetical protein CKK33_10045 [Mucilaginibacter sp. MD40]|nr:hypothetical protein CKK33_10045 [Mucilaginibacter sp. MD40]